MPKIIFIFGIFLIPISSKTIHFFYTKRNKSLKNKRKLKNMKQKKLTFNQICTRAEKGNSEKLMSKARLANRLAKHSRGGQR